MKSLEEECLKLIKEEKPQWKREERCLSHQRGEKFHWKQEKKFLNLIKELRKRKRF